jgi:nucleotide-binding universal stress UspA family protein
MFKTILLPVVSAGVEGPAFDTAISLARTFTSHIDFLYARPEPVTFGSMYGGAFIPDMLEQLRAASDRQHAETMRQYLDTCRREQIPTDIVGPAVGKVTARWHRETGKVANCVAEYGHASDIIVVERGSDSLTAQAIEGALFASGRPVLVPGLRPPSLDTIAIAWKPARESARAVAAALPLLAQAKRVVIMSVSEGGSVIAQDMERLAIALRRYQSSVETVFLEPDSLYVSNTLLNQAYRVGAGLMVMGAYSRPRLRELVLGGVTTGVLDTSELPVFMVH